MTQVCPQRRKAATEGILFPSSSSDKVYKVTAFRPDQFPFCSCPSYIFGRSKETKRLRAEGIEVHQNDVPGTCKHTQEVMAGVCDWRQDTDSMYQFDELCPKCGSLLVEEGDLEIPEDPHHAANDLRALLAEMNGEEAPAPILAPQPYLVSVEAKAVFHIKVDAVDEDEAKKLAMDEYAKVEAADNLGSVLVSVENPKAKYGHEIGLASQKAATGKPAKKAAATKKTTKKAAPRTRTADVSALVKGARK